ncbi:hypothetical protein B9Z19DRAFT_36798 [Tuber borchii]|uniref:Uncharacterized protein n=1 Tax=Tuber borchii TaxID=42251 RepID=A0A2T6ZTE2_TUBBO|nr:hypothetical protein B9Z19DRAFT_36798 [Tuber borchii]
MPTGSPTKSFRSSTTQREKGWEAIAKENQRFFLPISPTDSNDRPVLNVKVDFDGRFVGKSLLYLCIEVDIQASELQGERCMGYLDPSAVEIILQERSLIHAVESVARENMREERGPRNASRHPGNLANSGGYPDGHRIRESSFGQNDLGHSSLPLRREFSNGSNTRSAGRPSGASFRYPTRSSGAPTNSPRAPRQVGSLGAHENRGPDGNYINHQSCIPYQNSWSQDRPRPNRSPHHARIRGRAENPPVQNIGFSQTYTIGRSSDPTFIGLAAPVRRSSTEENQWHDPRHYQTKVNKNGSQKRQERLAREKPPQY